MANRPPHQQPVGYPPQEPRRRVPDGGRPPQRQGQPKRRKPQQQSSLLRNVVYAGLFLLLAAVAALVTLTFLFPGDVVRDRIAAKVKAETGRSLTMSGPVSFSFVPTAHVTMENVALSGPPGMESPNLAEIGTLEVGVSLLPLIWREVTVDSVVLRDPVFNLAVDVNGRRNWDVTQRSADAPFSPGKPLQLAQSATTANDASEPPQQTPSRRAISDISLRDMRIENGTVRFNDARKRRIHEATNISATIAMKSLTRPAKTEGSLLYQGQTINFDAEVSTVQQLVSQIPAHVAANIKSDLFTARYEGTLLLDNGELEGKLRAQTPALAKTASWLGAKVPNSLELGPLELTGQLRASGKSYTFSNARLTANGAAAKGILTLDAAPERPYLHGELTIASLDLNRFLRPSSPPSQVDGLQPPTRVQGYTARREWSEEPLRVTAMGAMDADLDLAVGEVIRKEVRTGRARLAVKLNQAVMETAFKEVELYGGTGQGTIVIDGRDPDSPRVDVGFTLNGISMHPLLQDAAKMDWIEGRGSATINVTGTGPNEKALIQSLSGQASIDVRDGAVRGIDIDRMAESLSDGAFEGLSAKPNDKTPFNSLTASWKIEDGVARNDDLRLVSKHVSATGTGSVFLPDQELDYTMKPSLGGNSGSGEGLEVPVRMSGPWHDPKYSVDVGGAVEQLGRRYKGKNAGEIIDDLIGTDENGESKAQKLLDKLFR